MSQVPSAKGTAFLGVFKFLKEKPGVLDKVMAALPPDTAGVLKSKIVAVADYPYKAFVDLLRACDKVLGFRDLSVCRDIGRYTARLDVATIYNLYKRETRPQDLSRDCSIIWRSYYTNAGRMAAEGAVKDRLIIRIHDFPGMDPSHCRLMEGWMAEALAESGGEWIEEIREVKCMSKGDEYHEFEGKWRPKS